MNTVTTQAIANKEDIRSMLGLLMARSPVIEIRALDTPKRTQSGYFDNLERAVEAAARLSGQGPAVYVTLNEVDPQLKARAYNRLEPYAKHTTADDNILRRLWFGIDADPKRPAGISSTDELHEAALQRIREVWSFLQTLGFPEGILADSGNGGHLSLAIDLPNTPENLKLLESCLEALDFHFSDGVVNIDRTTANAARIWKVYGTLAGKGDSLPEWPHRLARILHMPESLDVVPRELLEKLATMGPAEEAQPHTNGHEHYAPGEFDIEAWIRRQGLQVAKSGPWKDGRKYVLASCPWDPTHTDNSAYILQMPSGAIAAGCHHNGCYGKRWSDLRALFEGPRQSHASESRHNGTSSEDIPPKVAPVPAKPAADWPTPPGKDAYAGLAGRFVELASRHSEADDAALLGSFLTMAGAAIGAGPHMRVGATKHYARLFLAIVGKSSKARKGESSTPNRVVFSKADCEWEAQRIQSGLSSGEGVISAVRDRVERVQAVKGQPGAYENVVVDEGVDDKRLLAQEPEFARVLQSMRREGNTLSSVLRDAWDRGTLGIVTKTPMRATGAHIALICHITIDELRRHLTQTDAANGFGNRFLWLAVQRSKELPRPRPFEGPEVDILAGELRSTLEWARTVEAMDFDETAGGLWDRIYHDLSREQDGLLGSILGRAEAQVLRLAMVYALLDRSTLIRVPHLVSATQLWAYSERSALHIFGDAIGDPIADTILRNLRARGPMNRTEIFKLFSNHETSERIEAALLVLLERNKAKKHYIESVGADGKTGRPIEVWEAVV
jgi:hypothetical protein